MKEGFSASDNQQSKSFSEKDDLVSAPLHQPNKNYVRNSDKYSKFNNKLKYGCEKLGSFCKKTYIQVTGSSNTVVLSDSLLAHLWKEKEIEFGEQPTFHVLIGGKVKDITKLVPKIGDEAKNIIYCGGINNLPSQSSKQIIEELQELTKLLYKKCSYLYLTVSS